MRETSILWNSQAWTFFSFTICQWIFVHAILSLSILFRQLQCSISNAFARSMCSVSERDTTKKNTSEIRCSWWVSRFYIESSSCVFLVLEKMQSSCSTYQFHMFENIFASDYGSYVVQICRHWLCAYSCTTTCHFHPTPLVRFFPFLCYCSTLPTND